MASTSRDGFLRRLGRALRGVNDVEYGRPVAPEDAVPPAGPTPTLTTTDPAGPPTAGDGGADARRRP